MFKLALFKFLKELQHRSPLRRYFFPRYMYNFSPAQLCYLCQCLEETRDVPGDIAEIGCASGATTVFLNKHLESRGIEKRYVAIDTFAGFTRRDVDFEVSNRGLRRGAFAEFQVNRKSWFEATLESNDIQNVQAIRADVNEFDLSGLGPLAFALLDVDLYRPTRKAIGELYRTLSPGGILVVDNCDPDDPRWNGAYQAYEEFVRTLDRPVRRVHGKLGVIQKAPTAAVAHPT